MHLLSPAGLTSGSLLSAEGSVSREHLTGGRKGGIRFHNGWLTPTVESPNEAEPHAPILEDWEAWVWK